VIFSLCNFFFMETYLLQIINDTLHFSFRIENDLKLVQWYSFTLRDSNVITYLKLNAMGSVTCFSVTILIVCAPCVALDYGITISIQYVVHRVIVVSCVIGEDFPLYVSDVRPSDSHWNIFRYQSCYTGL
jgi:hypothetical protein